MPTLRQKRVAKRMIEAIEKGEDITKGQLLKVADYSKASQDNPARILDGDGVKEALEEFGFSEDNAKKVVATILNDKRIKPEARLNAADKVFKVHGSYAAEKRVNVNVEVEASEEIKKLAEKLNALYRGADQPGDGIESSSLDDQAQDKE